MTLSSRYGRWLIAAAGLFALSLVLALIPDYWHRAAAFQLYRTSLSGSATAPTLDLDRYVLTHTAVVEGVSDNLSGLAYDRDGNRLWAVTNAPTVLLALSAEGRVLARYPLEGFHDTEAVAYLGKGRLVVAEERSAALVVVTVPPLPGVIHRRDAAVLQLALSDHTPEDNAGLEGLAYDADTDRLYLTKERDPKGLYSVEGLLRSLAGEPFSVLVKKHELRAGSRYLAGDLSAVEVDRDSGRLLLLSDESRLLLETGDDGATLAIRSLATGLGVGADPIPQPEGIALDHRGNLYIVSEPNLFYRLSQAP